MVLKGVGRQVLGKNAVTIRLVGVYSGRLKDESDIGRVWTPDSILAVLVGNRQANLPLVGLGA